MPPPSISPPSSPKNVDSSSNFTVDISCVDISSSFTFDISCSHISTTDISSSVILDISNSTVFSMFVNDIPFDISQALHLSPDISLSSYVVTISGGIETITESGIKPDGTVIYQTIAFTTDASDQIQITEDLSAIIQIYDDKTDPSLNAVLQEITQYAEKINCSNFQGKGSIDDYTELFTVAANLAKDAKQTSLSIDIAGFQEFGNAADELSHLFHQYIMKIQNINVINDYAFLLSIKNSLQKISNLAEVFGRFKETILATSIIQIPKSLEDTRYILDGVMSEVDCAMKYINHFVCPEEDISMCAAADLSSDDKQLITNAVNTIKKWNNDFNENLQVVISENADVQFIQNANQLISHTASNLKGATACFKGKLSVLSKKSNK
jgi:hypothetical protein